MKKISVIILLLGVCLCLSTAYTIKSSSLFISDTNQIEIISDENADKIGKEVLNRNPPKVYGGQDWPSDTEELEPIALDMQIPENPFFSSLASDQVSLGTSVQEIATQDGLVPEFIIPNGAIGVFSKGNQSGWSCKAGDTLIWSFEKYPMENGISQSICVGYIKDDVMYEAQAFGETLEGEYELTVPEDGIYYIYVIGASSDPISMKGSDIQIR